MNREKSIDEMKMANDVEQLCHLIDQNTFDHQKNSSSKRGKSSSCLSIRFRSVPSCEVKAFRCSRLKRLNSISPSKIDGENSCRSLIPFSPSTRRTLSMRFSLSPSSLLNGFRSLSTSNLCSSRRSSSTITLFRTKSILPSIIEEDSSNLDPTTQLSCTIVDTRRSTSNSCNVEELTAYLDHFLHLPKSLSGAAELMYT